LNARQKRLFEESLKKNPNLKMPSEGSHPSGELTDEDMALLKQGVGDKSGRPQNSPAASGESSEEAPAEAQTGSVMTYFARMAEARTSSSTSHGCTRARRPISFPEPRSPTNWAWTGTVRLPPAACASYRPKKNQPKAERFSGFQILGRTRLAASTRF
jgi:hypothetical protein